MDRFIARENIKHFRNLLWSESDPVLRARVQKLLVEEEDKLAASLELLEEVERHIADGNRRIERQRELITMMERDGHDGLAKARNLLDGMSESQVLHTAYRERILIAVEQNRL